MSYEDVIAQIGDAVAAEIIRTLWALQDGDISREYAEQIMANLLASANSRAAGAAILAFAASIAELTGEPPIVTAGPPTMGHATNQERLRAAFGTILTSHELHDLGIELALSRITRTETAEAAASAFGWVLRDDDRVKGWKRGLDSNACQLCRWWSREGRTWPTIHVMPRHKGCLCTQIPVLS